MTKILKRFLLLTLVVLTVTSCGGEGKKKSLSSAEDLPGSVVGVMTGTCYDIMLSKREGVKVMRYNTITDMIAAVSQGRADCFVCDEFVINSDVSRENHLRKAFYTEEGFPCSFAFRKEDVAMVDTMTAMIRELRASGELEAIIDKWLNGSDYSSIAMTTDGQPEPTGKPLVVGVCENMAPLLFTVGSEWHGLEPELMQLFAHRIGRPMEVKYMDFAAMSAALQTGAIDVMASGIFVTEERKKVFLFPEPYMECRGAYIVLDEERGEGEGFWAGMKKSFNNNLLVENRWKFLADGLLVTIEITLLSILFGIALGVGLYLMRRSRRRWARSVAKVYGEFMRGIPVVVLLMILFYVVLTGMNAVLVAVVAFSMMFADFVAEIMVTSVEAVGRGQQEAGVAMGFSQWKTFRYIIGPQALRRALPHFKSEAVSLIKNTSIVGYIAIQDITRAGDMIRSRTFEAFFPLLVVTVIYFLLAWLLSKLIECLFKLAMKI